MIAGISLHSGLSCHHLGVEYKLSSVKRRGFFWSVAQVTAHSNQSLCTMTNLTLTMYYTPLRSCSRNWQSSRMSLQKFWNCIIAFWICWLISPDGLKRVYFQGDKFSGGQHCGLVERVGVAPNSQMTLTHPLEHVGPFSSSVEWEFEARWILRSFPEINCSDTLSRTKIRYLCNKPSKSALWIPGRVEPKAFVRVFFVEV